jgi:L1 cell adhesion molecule like protein
VGDGSIVMQCWKYSLPIFKTTNRRNYSIEAFHTLANVQMRSPRQRHQIIWSQFVNVHQDGVPGHNIPFDLHIEHINRSIKGFIQHLGANKTEKAIGRYSKSMSVVSYVLDNFDSEHKCNHSSGYHTVASNCKDRDLIIHELKNKAHAFKHIPGRCHNKFPKFTCNTIKSLKVKEFHKWLQDQANAYGFKIST